MVGAIGITLVGLLAVVLTAIYFFTRTDNVADNSTPPKESVASPASLATPDNAPKDSPSETKPKPKPAPKTPVLTTAPANSSEQPKSLADLIEVVEPAVVRIDANTSKGNAIGSGVLVNDQGWIVTNFHVIEDARSLKVTNHLGKETQALGFFIVDPKKDLAVIKIDPTAFEYSTIRLAQKLPRKGEEVAAFGTPMGFSFSATEGVVSSVRTGVEIRKSLIDLGGIDIYSLLGYAESTNWLQTSAAISGGNSGGPLVDMYGNLVGINTWTTPEAQNLNFASTVDEVRQILESAQTHNLYELRYLPKRKIRARYTPTGGSNGGRRTPGSLGPAPGARGKIEFDTEIKSPEQIREQKRRDDEKRIAMEERRSRENLVVDAGKFVSSSTGGVAREFKCDSWIKVLATNRERSHMAAITTLGTLYVFDMFTGKCNFYVETTAAFGFEDVKIIGKRVYGFRPRSSKTLSVYDIDAAKKIVEQVDMPEVRSPRHFCVSENEQFVFAIGAKAVGELTPDGTKTQEYRFQNKVNTLGYSAAHLSDDGSKAILVNQSSIEIFDRQGTEYQQRTRLRASRLISKVFFANDDKTMIYADSQGKLLKVAYQDEQPKVTEFCAVRGTISGLVKIPGRDVVVVARSSRELEIRDSNDGKRLATVRVTSKPQQLVIMKDPSFVVCGSADGKLRIIKMTYQTK